MMRLAEQLETQMLSYPQDRQHILMQELEYEKYRR